jgi:hypothetical protein
VNRGPYEPARARQLRILVWVVVGLAAMLIAWAVFLLIAGGVEPLVLLLLLIVPGLLMLAVGMRAQTLLGRGAPNARRWITSTGIITLLVGFQLSTTLPGMLVLVIGILTTLYALLPGRDSGAGTTPDTPDEPDEPDAPDAPDAPDKADK